jgi:hypothetical protein
VAHLQDAARPNIALALRRVSYPPKRGGRIELKRAGYLDQLQDSEPLRPAFEIRNDLLIPTETGRKLTLSKFRPLPPLQQQSLQRKSAAIRGTPDVLPSR